MATHYIKNFNANDFNTILKNIDCVAREKQPFWRGTVMIGKQALYLECHIKWLADKISDYFVEKYPEQHFDNSKELYILNEDISNYVHTTNEQTITIGFIDDNIYKTPDIIMYHNGLFIKNDNVFYFINQQDDKSTEPRLDENHLLMRLFGYIFDDNDNIVLHGSVVAYDDFGVLITGLSGSGKSTLAAYCLARGMKFVGDDRISFCKENNDIYANPIYTTLSLDEQIDGIKSIYVKRQNYGNKHMNILDKSQISKHIKINAVIEPIKTNKSNPSITGFSKTSIISHICFDYSDYSRLVRSTCIISDYKRILNLLDNIPFFRMELSDSIKSNIDCLCNFIKNKGIKNV